MSASLFRIALYASLAVCALGLLWRVWAWMRVRIGPDARAIPLHQRLFAALRGSVTALASRRLPGVLGAFLLDVLLQRRLFASDKVRWLGHLLILVGFTLLLVMHALAPVVTGKLFKGYVATVDPYLFLRNLFGAMAIVGVAVVMIGRRLRRIGLPTAHRLGDRVFVALFGIVMVSGFLLEGAKVASPKAFYRMTEEYLDTVDPDELLGLRVVWARDYGVAFADLPDAPDADKVAEGQELHNDACASCHSRPTSAFVSYPIARVLAPVSGPLDDAGADQWLWYIHVLACLLGLATLPFTRLFHALADPVSLMVNGAAQAAPLSAAGRASRRALAIDACVRCGLCDTRCSVAPIARQLDNPALLPSHKLLATHRFAGGQRNRNPDTVERQAEGAFLCTSCGRCTSRCPVGLDLEDLWTAGRADLAEAGHPAPAQWIQARSAIDWSESLPPATEADPGGGPLSSARGTFSPCVQCQTCTNVCPIVAHSIGPEDGVDLTPQKVMNLLRLGMTDLALGSRMVWNCATCYQCQEHCPEGIRVTDVILELRGLSYRRLGAARDRRRPE